MARHLLLLTLSLWLSCCSSYKYETYFFKQKVDHFSFADQDSFIQRYLISDRHWDHRGGPIFFYAGNEGDITLFAENTGFMWDIAPEFNALVIFAEHRYYGISLPYGNKSFTEPKYSGYLTSEQALADYVELLAYLKTVIRGAKNSPVIVFGGSYGGMLAAWFRIKYPHIVQGAIAASAPILQFTGLTPCEKFGQLVTADFAKESKECAEVIRKSWAAIDAVTADDSGLAWITKEWKLCKPLKGKDDVKTLKAYLMDVWTNLAMVDYPYPSDFLAPLPAYPIKEVCSQLTNPGHGPKLLLEELFSGLTVYVNFTGETKCVNIDQQADVRLDDRGWDFQACTEMVMPFCYDGVSDFFEPADWNFEEYAENCHQKWGVYPRPMMAPKIYGGKELSAASNIVFSNGNLDPWSTGGVLWNVSDSVVSVIIPEGAHHLDLRGSNPSDPESVIEARRVEKEFIKTWIDEYRSAHNLIDANATPHPCDDVTGVYSDWVSHAERVGVAIIGGGVSGLTAAKTLLESDVEDLLILEAKERLGGRVHTVREGNVVVEAGAEWIHGDEKNPLYRLAEELDALAPPPPEDWDFLTVTHYGKMADMDYYLELQELVSEFGDNASYLAPYEGLGLDAFFTDRYKSMFGEESTGEWKGWLHYLSKIVGSNFGCNDWATPEVTTTGAFEEYGEDNQWASGYDTLLDHLKASIPDDNIRLSTPVCRIFWDEHEEGELEEGQVLIVSKDGSSVLADHVIFTASSGHLQERHRQLFSPPLPGDYVSALEGIELGVANKVQMGWDDPWWGEDPLELDIVWTEFDLPEEKSWLYDLVLVFSVHLSPHAVIEGFVTGEASEIMESLSEEQVREHFLELLRNASLMSIPEPMFFRRTTWGSDPWVRGSYSSLITTDGFHDGLTSRASLRVPLYAGTKMVLQWAGEHTSPHRFSTVDGAMGTGEREAKRLLKALRLEGV